MSWEQKATELYKESNKLHKAKSAGIAIDNALKVEYSKGGTTKCHFMITNWLKYFDFEKQL